MILIYYVRKKTNKSYDNYRKKYRYHSTVKNMQIISTIAPITFKPSRSSEFLFTRDFLRSKCHRPIRTGVRWRSNEILERAILLSRFLMRIKRVRIGRLKLGVTFGCWLGVRARARADCPRRASRCAHTRGTYRWWVDKHRRIVQSTAYLVSLCRQFSR